MTEKYSGVCPNCEKNIKEGAKFCPHCGFKLSSALSEKNKINITSSNSEVQNAPLLREVASKISPTADLRHTFDPVFSDKKGEETASKPTGTLMFMPSFGGGEVEGIEREKREEKKGEVTADIGGDGQSGGSEEAREGSPNRGKASETLMFIPSLEESKLGGEVKAEEKERAEEEEGPTEERVQKRGEIAGTLMFMPSFSVEEVEKEARGERAVEEGKGDSRDREEGSASGKGKTDSFGKYDEKEPSPDEGNIALTPGEESVGENIPPLKIGPEPAKSPEINKTLMFGISDLKGVSEGESPDRGAGEGDVSSEGGRSSEASKTLLFSPGLEESAEAGGRAESPSEGGRSSEASKTLLFSPELEGGPSEPSEKSAGPASTLLMSTEEIEKIAERGGGYTESTGRVELSKSFGSPEVHSLEISGEEPRKVLAEGDSKSTIAVPLEEIQAHIQEMGGKVDPEDEKKIENLTELVLKAEKAAEEGKLDESIELYLELVKACPEEKSYREKLESLWKKHKQETFELSKDKIELDSFDDGGTLGSNKKVLWGGIAGGGALLLLIVFLLFRGGGEEKPAVKAPQQPKESFGIIEISSTPSGAEIWLNGEKTSHRTPSQLKLRGGTYEIELRHPKAPKVNKKVELKAGYRVSIDVILVSGSDEKSDKKVQKIKVRKKLISRVKRKKRRRIRRGGVRSRSYKLRIETEPPGAEIWLDGEKLDKLSPLTIDLKRSKASVKAVLKGYIPAEEEVSFGGEREKKLVLKLRRKGPKGMSFVPAGEFWMGNNAGSYIEKPMRKVYLSAFWIDRYEVRVKDYLRCVKSGFCKPPKKGKGCNASYPDRQNHPINCISWFDAKRYCQWRGKMLPTEAQWEKAARGTSAQLYPWGNGSPNCKRANYLDCGLDGTLPVGSKPRGKSPYGAFDMSGNVWEWIYDRFQDKYYRRAPSKNPVNFPRGNLPRVIRGGAWNTPADRLHASYRSDAWPSKRDPTIGFRCVKMAR